MKAGFIYSYMPKPFGCSTYTVLRPLSISCSMRRESFFSWDRSRSTNTSKKIYREFYFTLLSAWDSLTVFMFLAQSRIWISSNILIFFLHFRDDFWFLLHFGRRNLLLPNQKVLLSHLAKLEKLRLRILLWHRLISLWVLYQTWFCQKLLFLSSVSICETK